MKIITFTKKGSENGWPRWLSATVTRRHGWEYLPEHPGTTLAVWDWLPRIGARWTCRCGHLGSTRRPSGMGSGLPQTCPTCNADMRYRKPRCVGSVRVRSARREPLGAILSEPDGTLLEGLPHLSPVEFCRMYLGGKERPSDPADAQLWLAAGPMAYYLEQWTSQRGTMLDLGRPVTRIEYEVLCPDLALAIKWATDELSDLGVTP